MSIDQLKREYPFLRRYLPSSMPSSIGVEFECREETVRVSRISLDALKLSMVNVHESDIRIDQKLRVLGRDGKDLFGFGDLGSDLIFPLIADENTLGDILTRIFLRNIDSIRAKEVGYILHTIEVSYFQWRGHKGQKRSYQKRINGRFEAVIFKMPKSGSLYQLLKRYRTTH